MTPADAAFVSTGALPQPTEVARLVDEAYRRFEPVREGAVSDVYPALSVADPDRFGIAVMGVTGASHVAGDSGVPFSIMSVAKPFVFALACSALGPDEVRDRIGVNATGLPFNALSAVERRPAAAPTPWSTRAPSPPPPGRRAARRAETWERSWRACRRSPGAGSPSTTTSTSGDASNHRNRALAQFLDARGALDVYPDEAVDLYTRQSSSR